MIMTKLVDSDERVWARNMFNNALYRKHDGEYYLVKRWCIDSSIRETFTAGALYVKTRGEE